MAYKNFRDTLKIGLNASNRKVKGSLLALVAAVLWGISGVCAQFLFEQRSVNAEWLVTMRLLISGVLLLGLSAGQQKQAVLALFKDKKDVRDLIIFSLGGMLAVQYTYFTAISYSNAATSTILQYLGPVIIAAYLAIRNRKMPAFKTRIAIVLAIAGTFFLVTHGRTGSLSISGLALFWGISSAFALACYTLQPVRLLHRWPASLIIGWGMLIGGFVLSLWHQPWYISGHWDKATWALFIFIILFGTLTAFYAYLISIKYVGATVASLLACTEPLAAAFLSMVWLNISFGFYDWLGTACILATIVLLTLKNNPSNESAVESSTRQVRGN